MKSLFYFLISLFLPIFFFFLFACSVSDVFCFPSSQADLRKDQNQCLDNQRSALLQLHHSLYYAPNFTFFSKAQLWNLSNTDCCSWEGVTCDALGHVIELDLNNKNLSGSFQSTFNLHHLQRLNLAGNNFNTTLSSTQFHKLSNLTHLNLSDSCFYGQIPVEISYLTRLVSLDLSYHGSCYLRHNLPDDLQQPLKLENPNFKKFVKNLRSVSELHLDSVNISTQSSEWCETISLALPNLSVLSLSNCGLEGPFCASLSRLPFLSELTLDGNWISYLPPNFLENSSRLVSLGLADCNLSGHFPTQVFLLPKIQSIYISSNEYLRGQLPDFPINNTLQVLSLNNANFSGKIPQSIGNLKLLTTLDLYACNFFGSLPLSIANLTSLVQLDLGSNHFSGFIPPFHRYGVPNLAHLYMDWNTLSGPINSSLFTLPSLTTLYLGSNQLHGQIDEFPNASSSLIESLDISKNSFSSLKLEMFFQLKNLRDLDLSYISLSIGRHNQNLGFPQLQILGLSSCNLTEFPEFIKTQDNLVFLDLSYNKIPGFVPNWLWKIGTLEALDLSFNAIDFPKQVPFDDAN